MKLKESRIFSVAEHKSLKERLGGLRKDPTGIFASRVKPKLLELLNVWFPQKDALVLAVKKKDRVIK